jgi:hypothetical protein
MRRLVLATAAILSACSGNGGDKAADKAADTTTIKLQPGLWEMTSEITSMQIAGQSGNMPGFKAAKVTASNCITQAQVDQPQPTVFGGSGGGGCKYDNFYMSGGRLVSAMTCKQEKTAGEMHMSVEGKYSATSIEATVQMVNSLAGGNMNMTSKLNGRRVGECTAETPEKAAG